MNNRIKYGLGLIVALVTFLGIRACNTDRLLPVAFNTPLAPNTAAQIVIQNRHVAVRTDKETKAAYVPDGGLVTATIQKTGVVQLSVQAAAFTFQPVAGVLMSDRPRGALGAELAYWNRLELYGGLGLPSPVGFVGIGYRLDMVRWFENTSVVVIFDSHKQIGFGAVLHF